MDTQYSIRGFQDSEHTGDYGTVDPRRCVVSISNEVPLSYALRTVWHELLHVLQTNSAEECDESMPIRVSTFINQILMDNPTLCDLYKKARQSGQ